MGFKGCIKCGMHKGIITEITMSKTVSSKKINRILCEKCIAELQVQGWITEMYLND